ARDLGLPLDSPSAVRVIAAGQTRLVDAAEVNGRVFINNSSIGFYPRVVLHRDRLRRRPLLLSKWAAMFYATLAALRRYPQVEIGLDIPSGETHHRLTPFLFVGN